MREAGKEAMSEVGRVVRNPEVVRLLPTLMGGLAEPATKTASTLDALLQCEFVHSMDAAALALLAPVRQSPRPSPRAPRPALLAPLAPYFSVMITSELRIGRFHIYCCSAFCWATNPCGRLHTKHDTFFS